MIPINNSDTAWLIVSDYNQDNDLFYEDLREDIISPNVNEWYSDYLNKDTVGFPATIGCSINIFTFNVGDTHNTVGHVGSVGSYMYNTQHTSAGIYMNPINNSDTAWLIVSDYNQDNNLPFEDLRNDILNPETNQFHYEQSGQSGHHQVGNGLPEPGTAIDTVGFNSNFHDKDIGIGLGFLNLGYSVGWKISNDGKWVGGHI